MLSIFPRQWINGFVNVLNRFHSERFRRKQRWLRQRLTVETLEDRFAPAAVSWTGSAGTLNWGDANNWSNNAVPGSADDVTINKAGIGTIDIGAGSYAVHSLNDTTAALSIASGASLSLAAAAVTSTFGQNVTVQSGATLTVGAGANVQIGPAGNNVTQTIADNGTLTFGAGDSVTLNASVTPNDGYTSIVQIVVGSGGLLTASGSTFNGIYNNQSNGTVATQIVVNSGGRITVNNSTIALGELIFNASSNGTLSADIVSGTLAINSGATISISDNDLSNIAAKGVVASGDPTATISLLYNYWGTTTASQIAAKILDHTTDTTRPTVLYTPYLSVFPAAASFSVTTNGGIQTTGVPFNVTVTADDLHGNQAPGYTGTVSITSTDPAAPVLVPSYTFVPGDNGVHTFSVILNTSTLASGLGTTIIVRDINATTPPLSGFSPAITVQGLVVPANGFQPTATGFSITFSKPFTPADLTEYGSNLATVADVTLVGANSGKIPGSLSLDPTTPNTLVFKASSAYLLTLNAGDGFGPGGNGDVSAGLPDDTYTVTLVSGAGSNGFVDALGNHLDGLDNGTVANWTTAFTTSYQDDGHNNANPMPVLAIPDFARGPDSATTITVPNNKTAPGIPVTLYNVTNSVTDATFTLTYNPAIFTPTAGGTGDSPAGSTFTMGTITSIDSTHSSVTFIYHNATGHTGTIVLGDILAIVPNSAASIYKTKELLALSNISITGGATVQASDGIHVDAYLGDVHVRTRSTISYRK